MTVKELLEKMDRSKRDDGSYNNEILAWLPEIEKFFRNLKCLTLEQLCAMLDELNSNQK